MKREPRVIEFSLTGRWALYDTGATVPITNLYCMGVEIQNPEGCDVFVCGTDAAGWFAVTVANFEEAMVN